jgi:transposase InsO family protein
MLGQRPGRVVLRHHQRRTAPPPILAHTAARTAIFDYIEGWYNTRGRHSTLGHLSPAAYEATAATHAA